MIDRKKIVKVFYQYVQGYDDSDGKVILKIEHTMRVAVLCDRIGTLIGLRKEEIDLAWLLGMLHDIGRFEQLRRYGIFDDEKSINHAHLGVSLLFEEGLIRDYVAENGDDEMIKTALWNHNVFALPENLDRRTKLFCDLIRDADKIDIFKVIADIPLETIYGFDTDELRRSVISSEVMESFLERHTILHKLKNTPVDYVAGHASLAYELMFPCSIQIVKEQGFLEKILKFESKNQVTKEQFALLRREMEHYIHEINGVSAKPR